MKVQYLLEASNELNEAFDYIAGHASLGTAAALLADIEAAEKLLLQFPNAGNPIGIGLRRVMLKTFPYQLIYRVQDDRIQILAVAHLRRKPRYWRRRVPPRS